MSPSTHEILENCLKDYYIIRTSVGGGQISCVGKEQEKEDRKSREMWVMYEEDVGVVKHICGGGGGGGGVLCCCCCCLFVCVCLFVLCAVTIVA